MEIFISLIPLILTIGIAVKTKNVILALFMGLFSATIILAKANIVQVYTMLFLGITKDNTGYIASSIADSTNVAVLMLIMIIGGFVSLMEASDGAYVFATKITKFLKTKILAQLGAYLMGLIIFFSDIGTPLIVGPVFQPIFKLKKVSMEKLSYIIDSTASPIAVIVPFTGWAVYVTSLIQEQIDQGLIQGEAFAIYLDSIAFQFYCVLAVVAVPVAIITKTNLFAMKKAEDLAELEEYVHPSNIDDTKSNAKASFIIVPLVVLFAILFTGLFYLGFPYKTINGSMFRLLLTSAYFTASIILMVMIVFSKKNTFKEVFDFYVKGMQKSTYMIIVLVLAWAFSSAIADLKTAENVVGLLDGNLPVFLIPALIFITGAVLSFSTGSSWGTFAILTPFAIALGVSGDISPAICMGAVLSGGLFGDHLSPISDTTILAAAGSNVGLVEHVKTQFGYGIICGIIAFVFYLIAAIVPSNILIWISILVMIITFLIIKKLQLGWLKNETLVG